jgi:hypothetical protein
LVDLDRGIAVTVELGHGDSAASVSFEVEAAGDDSTHLVVFRVDQIESKGDLSVLLLDVESAFRLDDPVCPLGPL